MPSCTVLLKVAVMARTLGSAAASGRRRRWWTYTSSIRPTTGAKYANTVDHGSRSKSMRAVVRKSSAGANRKKVVFDSALAASPPPKKRMRPAAHPTETTTKMASSLK